MTINVEQKNRLEKVFQDAIGIGYGMFSVSKFYEGAEKDIVIRIYKHDNFFEHKPTTYSVSVGSCICELTKVQEKETLRLEELLAIVENF